MGIRRHFMRRNVIGYSFRHNLSAQFDNQHRSGLVSIFLHWRMDIAGYGNNEQLLSWLPDQSTLDVLTCYL